MKLTELHLVEETLQKAVKRLMKPAGPIEKVMGEHADAVAKLLSAKTSDPAYALKGETPLSKQILKSLVGTRAHDNPDGAAGGLLFYSVRMPGGAKIVVVGEGTAAWAMTSENQLNQLVEGVEPKED